MHLEQFSPSFSVKCFLKKYRLIICLLICSICSNAYLIRIIRINAIYIVAIIVYAPEAIYVLSGYLTFTVSCYTKKRYSFFNCGLQLTASVSSCSQEILNYKILVSCSFKNLPKYVIEFATFYYKINKVFFVLHCKIKTKFPTAKLTSEIFRYFDHAHKYPDFEKCPASAFNEQM